MKETLKNLLVIVLVVGPVIALQVIIGESSKGNPDPLPSPMPSVPVSPAPIVTDEPLRLPIEYRN